MENKPKFHPDPKLKLMEQVREVLRYHHYAYRTEQTYCQWILRFIHFFGGKTHPRDLGAKDVERFLSDLVVRQKVSASTQRQALNARCGDDIHQTTGSAQELSQTREQSRLSLVVWDVVKGEGG